jgi:hypothetical protein
MEKKWVMIRVTASTHAALCRIRASMELADEMQLRKLNRDHLEHVSLNHVIELLCEARDKHAERRSRSNARRRRPAVVELVEQPAEPDQAAAELPDGPADFS